MRSTRGALPVFPPVSLPEPPPEPGVPVTRHRALHKPRHDSCGHSSRGRPRTWDYCSPVSVARRADLRRVEQLSFLRARPPSAPAVAATEFLHGDPAVFTAQPSDDPGPGARPRSVSGLCCSWESAEVDRGRCGVAGAGRLAGFLDPVAVVPG